MNQSKLERKQSFTGLNNPSNYFTDANKIRLSSASSQLGGHHHTNDFAKQIF